MIFLSHSSADKPFVQFIGEELRVCGHPYWLDVKELVLGQTLSITIEKAIASSSRVLVFLSRTSLRSEWVRREMAFASKLAESDKPSFIPCLIGDLEPIHLPSELANILCLELKQADQYEQRMAHLLGVIKQGAQRAHLPPFDSVRCDHLVACAQADVPRSWVLRWLCGIVNKKPDATERYWIYVVIGELGDVSHVSFLESVVASEQGLARTGAQDGLDILLDRLEQK